MRAVISWLCTAILGFMIEQMLGRTQANEVAEYGSEFTPLSAAETPVCLEAMFLAQQCNAPRSQKIIKVATTVQRRILIGNCPEKI